MLDGSWLKENISRKVGDGSSTLFWKDPWLDGMSLGVRFRRLFELAVNDGGGDVFFGVESEW